MRSPRIVGFGLALRTSAGLLVPETLALKVYVDRKRPARRLAHPVPPSIRVPGLSTPIEIDVEEIGRVRTQSFRGRFRPARPGISLSHRRAGVGTLGCLVRHGGDSALHVLGAGHVLAPGAFASVGDRIVQPSAGDGGRAGADALARLVDFTRIDFSSGHPNRFDAAIAIVLRPGDVSAAVAALGVIPFGVAAVTHRGQRVRKVGRTTGSTVSEVVDVDLAVRMDVDTGNGWRRAGFDRQIGCRAFTEPGDSGSAVLDDDDGLVGLHLGAADSMSVFSPMQPVFDALDLELP